MKARKILSIGMISALVLGLAACGSNGGSSDKSSSKDKDKDVSLTYTGIKLGESGKDIETSIKVLSNRTDMLDDDYAGVTWNDYITEFNKDYPGITVKVEGVTDYAEDSLLRLQSGDWGDVMMIPEIDRKDLASYFLSYGTHDDVSTEANYTNRWIYDGDVYGIPSTAVGRGIVYNKKVFADAGVTELPKTIDEFINALKAISEKTDAIPLYTNYAAGWTMGAWDDYIGGTATGDEKYMNQELPHASNPFSDTGDETHAYNVYKLLYEAVANGLIEDDYTTTDWEGSKGMINGGDIGCMVLGSWAYPQMQQAGANADDIGYMAFPITVDGTQYSAASPDYNYGINVKSDATNQEASMIFVKWMTEKSGFSFNEGGLPIQAGVENYPDVYKSFIDNKVTFIEDAPAVEGEEDLLNTINADSELMVAAGGNDKIQYLIEHADNKDKTFDEIMDEWNEKWTSAQESNDVEIK